MNWAQVIGYGKSAIDIACSVAQAGGEVRQPLGAALAADCSGGLDRKEAALAYPSGLAGRRRKVGCGILIQAHGVL